MNSVKCFVLSVTLATGSGGLSAQVYETKDAEGRPVFSDQSSEGAVEVDVEPTNVGDGVDVNVPTTREPSETPSAGPKSSRSDSTEYEEELDREMEEYRLEQERLEAERHSEKRHKVGHDASEQRREVGHDASEQRHKVGHDSSEKRREVR